MSKRSRKEECRTRNWCITCWDTSFYEKWQKLDIKKLKITYMIYQEESGNNALEEAKNLNEGKTQLEILENKMPSTEEIKPKSHLQGYLELENVLSHKSGFKHIKKILECPELHCEPRKGTAKQASDYCKKTEGKIREPIILGEISQVAGARNDLKKLYENLKSGKSDSEILDEDPATYIKYSRGIEKARAIITKNGINTYKDIKITVFWGKPGVGKTRKIYELHKPEEVHVITKHDNNSTIWFDGYTGQKILLIDEFYGWIEWGRFLQILDKYKLQLAVKGSFTYSNWEKVYITSNKPPEMWYPDQDKTALYSRIDHEEEITAPISEIRKSNLDNMLKNIKMRSERSVENDSKIILKTNQKFTPCCVTPLILLKQNETVVKESRASNCDTLKKNGENNATILSESSLIQANEIAINELLDEISCQTVEQNKKNLDTQLDTKVAGNTTEILFPTISNEIVPPLQILNQNYTPQNCFSGQHCKQLSPILWQCLENKELNPQETLDFFGNNPKPLFTKSTCIEQKENYEKLKVEIPITKSKIIKIISPESKTNLPKKMTRSEIKKLRYNKR